MKLGVAVLVWGLGRAALAAEPCPPLPTTPLPAIADKPVSGKSLSLSRRAADLLGQELATATGRFAEGSACIDETAGSARRKLVFLLDDLVRREPADFPTRIKLVEALREAASDEPDRCAEDCRALRRRFVTALEQIRDGAYAGCRACVRWLAEHTLAEVLGGVQDAPEVEPFVDSLAHGPPGKLADATRAVLAWLANESRGPNAPGVDDDTAAGPIGPNTQVRIEPQLYSSGSDHPRVTLGKGLKVRGRKGLATWATSLDGPPSAGNVMMCDTRCCHWPFHDPAPHYLQLVDLCFDKALHLVLIRTRQSGM